tara:strand:- start:256 stop:705 length:450 start_codon:yes stop_codon:yes gene_type:complete
MAIINNSIKKYTQDENKNVRIGLDYPISLAVSGSDGYFASTNTTIEAVKNNIKSLLNTHAGERLMQPTLGLNLKKYLFEQYTFELGDHIKNEILDTFKFWLPFVVISRIDVNMSEVRGEVGRNTMNISMDFSISKDPSTLESIDITIGE